MRSSAPERRLRYLIVGLGARSAMYRDALTGAYAQRAELAACVDSNRGRLELAVERTRRDTGRAPTAGAPDSLEQLIATEGIDRVIVTSVDATHQAYVCRALMAGCDVIVEKPLATTADDCRAIRDAVTRSGRRCTVTFNYRYSPVRGQLKGLLDDGVIGEVVSIDFHWMLDTHHGADYYRRWHSQRKNSGGLFVHKATHHFDLVNWWLRTVPKRVSARGRRAFYLPETATRLGLERRGERCLDCPVSERCDFSLSLARSEELEELYLQQEAHDGYLRDRCVFRPDIDIEDSMTAMVEYESGALMSYSLNAFCSWEGYEIAFNGTRGRIEHRVVETTDVSDMGAARGAFSQEGTRLRVMPLRGDAYDVEPERSQGGHGGGDERLLADVLGTPAPDPLARAADHQSGINSVLVGAAANLSLASQSAVDVDVEGCRLSLAPLR